MEDKAIKNWNNLARSWAWECESIIRSWKGYEGFVLSKLDLDWSSRRKSSRGGMYAEGPGISIAMNIACMIRTEPYRMYEYKSFDADPVIGGFYAKDHTLPLAMHVCHEMAHAAQFYAHCILGIVSDRPHGIQFKTAYAKLRKAAFNKHIPLNQQQLKDEYYQLIDSVLRGA